jgi:hypothetical protein
MNKSLLLALAVSLTACTGTRVSRYDEFENVKVDKMVGNAVQPQLIGRTVICLNAMREERWPQPVTNQSVTFATNYVITSVTNMTVTSSANQQLASNTNVTIPQLLSLTLTNITENETNAAPVPTIPADSVLGGAVVSTSENESIASGLNQQVVSRTVQAVTVLNQQATVNSNNLAVTTGTNQTITVETNWVITTLTNQLLAPVTNVVIRTAEQPVYDFYLYTEIAPADFALSPGENLVLLVDTNRYSFSSSSPVSGWQGRRGFLTTFYKVPSDLISQIANASEVKLRLKTPGGTVERDLSRGSIENFRTFLLKNVEPDKVYSRVVSEADRPQSLRADASATNVLW